MRNRNLFPMVFLAAGLTASASHGQPAPAPAAAPRAELPIEAFASLPAFSSPSLSPDGTRLAARVAMQGRQQFAIVPLSHPDERPVLISVGEDQDLNSWTWTNDDWLAVSVGVRESVTGYNMVLRRLLGIDRQASVVNRIGWREAGQIADDIIWVAKDGTPRILYAAQGPMRDPLAFYPKVMEANLSNGRTKTVHMPYDGVFDWFADASGTVRMGYGYNDRLGTAKLLYRDGPGDGFETISRVNVRRGEAVLAPSIFGADRTKAIAISDKDGYSAVYELSLPDLTLGRKIFGAKGYDVDGVIPTMDRTGMAGVTYTADRPMVEWLDPTMRRTRLQIEISVGADRAHIVSWNRDRTRMIVHVGAANQAGAYYLYDKTANALTRLAWLNETFKDQELASVRTVRYRARDDVEIAAVLTVPRGREARNLPVIVMPHGGPFARDDESWDWWAQFLADRGYAVIQPNYRGSSGYGSAFSDLAEGQWGLKMQDDLNDALAYLVAQGIADPRRACIVGASYGGYAALRAAERDPALYRCAISYAGVSDLAALMRYDRNFLNSRTRRRWMNEQAPDFRQVSPIHHAARFGIPVLLMHGDKDVSVPVSQSREMVQRLRAAGKAFRYVEQPDADHHFSRGSDRLQFLKEMEAFLDEHNPS